MSGGGGISGGGWARCLAERIGARNAQKLLPAERDAVLFPLLNSLRRDPAEGTERGRATQTADDRFGLRLSLELVHTP